MENEGSAPPPKNDTVLARLRTQEFRTLALEAEVAVLQLRITHNEEDLAATRGERAEFKARWARSERELAEVRGKYEGLKRRVSVAPPMGSVKVWSGSLDV
jgi:chromosome segregation ATPase